MIDKTLSHYRITEKLGQGGMGEVYRAEDTNLSRQVAIKVLPDEFAHDAVRLARFQREAQVLASLNHPNIATLYGLEESDGKRFIVMELVEGQTLAHRLLKGPLRVDEAQDLCRQIAEGLEAAHEKGVIHRDLKPGNVMITPGDKVKILDFGLAKALAGESQAADVTHSPTITEAMTRPGVILGTAAYMSPEQAKGKTVDRRTDIWAFGCVLYECLTAKRAFQGETITETVAAILRSEPDWTLLPAETSSSVRAVLGRCLQKDPARRLHDISDARIEMVESASQPLEAVALPRRLSARWLLAWALAGGIACALVGASLMWHFRRTPSSAVVRAIIRIEPGQSLAGVGRPAEFWRPSRTAMAISSDGRFIVYSAIEGNPSPQAIPRLYMRRTDQMEAKPIEGTKGGISPFLSPDDRWVGFYADGKLSKVSVEGGMPVTLCNAPLLFGASWGSDHSIVFSSQEQTGLFRVSAEGGSPEPLTTLDRTKEEYSHRLPYCLPESGGVLFTIMRELWDLKPRVAVLEQKTRKWRVLLEDAADARYVPTGHLVFLRQGNLMAVPFDLGSLEVTGQPVPAVANVMQALNVTNSELNTGAGQFSFSSSGLLIYASGGIVPDLENSLVWVDQTGAAQPIADFKAPFWAPRLSPDGQWIVYNTLAREQRGWLYDLSRGTTTVLTREGKVGWVNWAPDGKRLAFDWRKLGVSNLFWQAADGSSAMERLTTNEYSQCPGSWTPDGAAIAFVEEHPDTGYDIYVLRLSDRRSTPVLNSRFSELYPEFSPDGHWLVYSSNESGRMEVYAQPFPGPGSRWQISREGGSEPLWARNGKQLFYRLRDQVWAVDVVTDVGFTTSRPRLLFEKSGYASNDPIRDWDISPDGQRFLMVKREERKPQPVTEMILVQNWFEEIKWLAPTGKN